MMKTKKIRKVILKTPSLRKMRNNLRIILKLAVNEELCRLNELYYLYRDKRILTQSQKERMNQLGVNWKALDLKYSRSTLQCSSGAACISLDEAIEKGFDPQDRPTDLDLVWVPWLKAWSCIKCFKAYRRGEMTHDDFDDPVYREWVEKEFGI